MDKLNVSDLPMARRAGHSEQSQPDQADKQDEQPSFSGLRTHIFMPGQAQTPPLSSSYLQTQLADLSVAQHVPTMSHRPIHFRRSFLAGLPVLISIVLTKMIMRPIFLFCQPRMRKNQKSGLQPALRSLRLVHRLSGILSLLCWHSKKGRIPRSLLRQLPRWQPSMWRRIPVC